MIICELKSKQILCTKLAFKNTKIGFEPYGNLIYIIQRGIFSFIDTKIQLKEFPDFGISMQLICTFFSGKCIIF